MGAKLDYRYEKPSCIANGGFIFVVTSVNVCSSPSRHMTRNACVYQSVMPYNNSI